MYLYQWKWCYKWFGSVGILYFYGVLAFYWGEEPTFSTLKYSLNTPTYFYMFFNKYLVNLTEKTQNSMSHSGKVERSYSTNYVELQRQTVQFRAN